MRKRIFWGGWIIFSLTLFLGAWGTAGAAYPEKPITFIVTWPAGGSSDQLARVLCNSAEKILGKPIIVENKPGGGTMVGTAYFSQQRPDGYTIGLLSTSYIRNSLMVKVPFDPIKSFTAIMRVGDNINGIVVRSDSPFKTLKDLIDYGKTNEAKINYATSGVGAASHIGIEALTQEIGVKWQHIPFKGSADALAAILGGHVTFMATTSVWVPQVQAGKLRLLGVYGERRSKNFPDVPTLLESGYDVTMETTEAVMAPRGIPEDIKKKLHDTFKKTLEDPKVLSVMNNLNMDVYYQSGPDYDKQVVKTYAENEKILKKIGLYQKE
jgi:tripartite-type tricarboxylate transporter receptor subunit TctC